MARLCDSLWYFPWTYTRTPQYLKDVSKKYLKIWRLLINKWKTSGKYQKYAAIQITWENASHHDISAKDLLNQGRNVKIIRTEIHVLTSHDGCTRLPQLWSSNHLLAVLQNQSEPHNDVPKNIEHVIKHYLTSHFHQTHHPCCRIECTWLHRKKNHDLYQCQIK